MLNDYEANGYGILTLNQESEELKTLYMPEQKVENLAKIVYGVGTSIGMAFMMRPDEESNYYHYPSEVGAIAFPQHNK